MASVNSRYARALADVVFDKKLIPGRIREQVHSFVELLNSSPDLRNVWDNPSVASEQKRKLLDVLCGRLAVDPMVRNFLAVLIDHHRIVALPQIARQFDAELDARLGIADAEVASARVLSPEERQLIEAQISKITGKSVRATYSTDKGLLGGAVVKLGSTVYDGSVRGQLEKIKETLSAE